MKLISIPAGDFVMGAAEHEVSRLKKRLEEDLAEEREETTEQRRARVQNFEALWEVLDGETHRHRVVITKPFCLGVYVVTQKEFSGLMGWNPSAHSAQGRKKDKLAGIDTSRHPVERVTWEDAAEFCRQLSSLPAEVAAGRTYRLPTEAEWEYASRAGTATTWHWGQTEGPAALEHAWTIRDSGDMTHPVGKKKPNPWGLYDMSGNVAEWCGDWFDPEAYSTARTRDPAGPASGSERVLRGGSADVTFDYLRSAARSKAPPDTSGDFRGFRVACDVSLRALPAPQPPVAKADSDYQPGVGTADPEARLKWNGLTKQGVVFVLPEEAQLVRYVTTLEHMRVACFRAQKECADAQRQLALVKAAKAQALKSRINARNYITSATYCAGWREVWAGRRARDNATDAMLLADMSRADILQWRNDARADFENDVNLFAKQCGNLRRMSEKMQAEYARLAADGATTKALDELNSAGKATYRLGPDPATRAAIRRLENEEGKLAQLKKR